MRVVASCVCGSDLWPYRGVRPTEHPHPIGHEFVGVVEQVGDNVEKIDVGNFVIAPFYLGDGTLIPLRGGAPAVSGGVGDGSTVTVVGDGAVGLSAIIAAKRLGAARIVAMSRHADRQTLALEFGATDIVAERGQAGVDEVKDIFDGIGPEIVLETASPSSCCSHPSDRPARVEREESPHGRIEQHRSDDADGPPPRGRAVGGRHRRGRASRLPRRRVPPPSRARAAGAATGPRWPNRQVTRPAQAPGR